MSTAALLRLFLLDGVQLTPLQLSLIERRLVDAALVGLGLFGRLLVDEMRVWDADDAEEGFEVGALGGGGRGIEMRACSGRIPARERW